MNHIAIFESQNFDVMENQSMKSATKKPAKKAAKTKTKKK
jgi:hypothetical protein